LKKKIKIAADYVSLALLKAVFLMLTPFSIHFIDKLAEFTGLLIFCILFSRRRAALKNLDIAFQNTKSRREKTKIAIESFRNFVKGVFELRYYYARGPGEINRRFSYRGIENYTGALKKGPVLFISAHVGQFPIMVCKFILDKYKVHLILKALSNEPLEKLFNVYRRRLAEPDDISSTLIYYKPRFLALKKALRELRAGRSIFIFVDQKFSKGVNVRFFGRNVLAAPGADSLARKSAATVLTAFAVRKGTKHEILIGKPVPVSADEGANIQAFLAHVEDIIRKYPEQWWWFHKRWQSV